MLTISSHALKRQLARDVAIKYKEVGVFTEFKKESDQFIVKKWYKKNNFPANKQSSNVGQSNNAGAADK